MNALTKFKPLTPWEPLREMQRLQRRMDSLFNRVVGQPIADEEAIVPGEWAPAVDIVEDENEYLIKAELPGLKREEVKVSVGDGSLSISGERKSEKEEKGKKFHRVERSYGSFQRTFTLPEGANAEKIAADFKDGVLKIHLPKEAKAKGKTIDIKAT